MQHSKFKKSLSTRRSFHYPSISFSMVNTICCKIYMSHTWLTLLRKVHLVKKFPSIYGPKQSLLCSQYPTPCSSILFLEDNFNIVLPFTLRSSKQVLSLTYPHQNPICTSLPPYMSHAPNISYFLIWYVSNNVIKNNKCWIEWNPPWKYNQTVLYLAKTFFPPTSCWHWPPTLTAHTGHYSDYES